MAIGSGPIGSGPFGIGTPVSGVAPPIGPPAGARYIDPGARDYTIDDSTGQYTRMPVVRQRMLIKLLTVRGSSTVLPELGLEVPRRIGPDFEARVRSMIRVAYKQETDIDKVARIDAVRIDRSTITGRVTITIEYTDLTTGQTDELTV